MKYQVRMRHLFIAVFLAFIAICFVVLHFQRVQLDKRELDISARKQRMDSSDWKFKALRGLSVDSSHQREAMKNMIAYWDKIEYRNGGSWPKVDGRRINTMIFTNANPNGATVTVVVLMDLDEDKAVDALSFVSDATTERHYCSEIDGEQYKIELRTYSLNDPMSIRNRTMWTLGPSGLFERNADFN